MKLNEKINKLLDNEVAEVEGWNFVEGHNRVVINDSCIRKIGRIKSRLDNNKMLLNINSIITRDANNNQWVIIINQGR